MGSWYLADVLALKERQRRLVVEYHDFDNLDGTRIQESPHTTHCPLPTTHHLTHHLTHDLTHHLPPTACHLRASLLLRTQEETGAGFVRPQPPSAPEGWLSGLREGARLEVRHAEGWWEAVLVSVKAGGGSSRRQQGAKFHVKPAAGCELYASCPRSAILPTTVLTMATLAKV